MDIKELLNNKGLKPKEKTEALSKWLLEDAGNITKLLNFAKTAKDSPKATCIEALEFATQHQPQLATLPCLEFVSQTLTEKAPRVKWESAKVIGNIAHLYPKKLDDAINNLLVNTEHAGTVVRWSAAFALGQIIQLQTPQTKNLLPALEAICKREEKNSIKKIYITAFKKLGIKL